MHPDITLVDHGTTIFWFRRDLRLEDNAGFYLALKENKCVLPAFIFDTEILDKLEEKTDRRVNFIHRSLLRIKNQLEQLGSSLLVLVGNPVKLFAELRPLNVYANEDYEPYARKRDAQVEGVLAARGVTFRTVKDHVIFGPNEVLKDDGTPYSIFTPYSRKWKAKLNGYFIKSHPVEDHLHNLKKVSPLATPTLEEIGFSRMPAIFPEVEIDQAMIANYHLQRNFPGEQGTTRLSVHLRFGTVSIRKLVQLALSKSEALLTELIWRDFYQMILWNFPRVENAFKPPYDSIVWRNNPEEFLAWCEGRTGYPIVDAGMRELNETGFMHNRVRMIVASFLVKHLLIDWRWGEAYFAEKLLDFDLAANNGGWQWASGSGCDAAPYFRVFNPYVQAKKFDPELKYIKRWVPEVGTSEYPGPMVEHKFARERALRAYKSALAGHTMFSKQE